MTSPTVVLARSSCCDAYLSNRDKLFNGLARIPKAASTSCLFYDDSSKSLSRSIIFIFFSFLFVVVSLATFPAGRRGNLSS